MKNVDIKKLLVLIGILAVVGVIIFFVIKGVNNNKENKEIEKAAETVTLDYYINLTAGYNTNFGGLDVLFVNDKTTVENLHKSSILTTAIRYASEKHLDYGVSKTILDSLNASKTYGNIDDYAAYKGEAIRTAVKELFGDIKYVDSSSISTYEYLNDYYYNNTFDVYLVKRNNVTSNNNEENTIEHHVIETKKQKDGKIITTIAIAYVHNDGTNKTYSKDKLGKNVIVENSEKFPEDKADEFEKYNITVKPGEKDKYVFESIEKVK